MVSSGNKIKIGIIGAGKVGSSLSDAFFGLGMLDWVIARSEKSAENVKKINEDIPILRNFSEIKSLPDIVFLSVNDKNLSETSETLANYFGSKLKDKLIVHCSGSCSITVLDDCKVLGAKTAVAHPYQTFYFPSGELLKGIAWAVFSEFDISVLKSVITKTGGKTFDVDLSDDKTRGIYHSSAVIASNYMNIIINLAKSLADKIKLPVGDFLIPILQTTLENNIKTLTESGEIPLTGPISRNDTEAVKLHLDSLSDDKEISNVYRLLSLAAAKIAYDGNIIDKETLSDFTKLLADEKNR